MTEFDRFYNDAYSFLYGGAPIPPDSAPASPPKDDEVIDGIRKVFPNVPIYVVGNTGFEGERIIDDGSNMPIAPENTAVTGYNNEPLDVTMTARMREQQAARDQAQMDAVTREIGGMLQQANEERIARVILDQMWRK